MERSRPSSCRMAATVAALASGPAMTAAGSAGHLQQTEAQEQYPEQRGNNDQQPTDDLSCHAAPSPGHGVNFIRLLERPSWRQSAMPPRYVKWIDRVTRVGDGSLCIRC